MSQQIKVYACHDLLMKPECSWEMSVSGKVQQNHNSDLMFNLVLIQHNWNIACGSFSNWLGPCSYMITSDMRGAGEVYRFPNNPNWLQKKHCWHRQVRINGIDANGSNMGFMFINRNEFAFSNYFCSCNCIMGKTIDVISSTQTTVSWITSLSE